MIHHFNQSIPPMDPDSPHPGDGTGTEVPIQPARWRWGSTRAGQAAPMEPSLLALGSGNGVQETMAGWWLTYPYG